MDRYIGLDVHAQTTTLCVMGPSERRLSERVVETHGAELRKALREVAGRKHVCLEEGMHAEWLAELLEREAERVVVTVPPQRRGPKSDTIDAWWLAEQLRKGTLATQVYKSRISPLKEAVRSYDAMTKHAVRAQLQLRFLFRGRGLDVERAQIRSGEISAQLLRTLPKERRLRAELHIDLVKQVQALRDKALEELSHVAKTSADVQRLMGVPGIGLIRAAHVVAILGTPHRFRSARQLWAYAGLGVVTRSSSDWVPTHGKMVRKASTVTRGLNRNGHPALKALFKGAAMSVLSAYPKHPWSVACMTSVEAGTRLNLARLTLARRIASTVLALWKRKEDFDPKKIQVAATA